MLGDAVHRHDVREVDLRGSLAGEFNLCLLSCFLKTLERHRVLLEVNSAVLCSELLGQPVDDDLVKVVTAEVGVTVGGENLEHAVTKLEDGDIEGTAAKVIHCNLHVLVFLVKAIGKCSCRGLVDDTLHIQTCNTAGFLGCLTLGV